MRIKKALLAILFAFACVTILTPSFSAKAETLEEWEKDYWLFGEHAGNFAVAGSNFTTGSKQTVGVTFDIDDVINTDTYKVLETENWCYISIFDSDGESVAVNSPALNGKAVAAELNTNLMQSFSFSDLKAGKNTFTVDCHFDKEDRYTLLVYQSEYSIYFNTTFIVKKGSSASVKDTVSVTPDIVEKGTKQNLTVTYTVSDVDFDYEIYICEPQSDSFFYSEYTYEVDRNNLLDSQMIFKEELAGTLGQARTVTFSGINCEKEGKYLVALYNKDTEIKVAVTSFTATTQSKSLGSDIDTTGVDRYGYLPFKYTVNTTHLDLDSKDELKLNVQLPFNYSKYKEDFERQYSLEGTDTDDISSTSVNVYYTPADSNSKRLLFSMNDLKSVLVRHEIRIKANDILDAILETGRLDSSFAGIVSVEFSQNSTASIYTNGFNEKFNFSVARNSKLVSAKAVKSSVPRAYGENASFTAVSTCGGKVYAEIYKGKKKVATAVGGSTIGLGTDGNVFGSVDFNLKNGSGKYLAAGSYKAKIYTMTTLKVVNGDDVDTKKVKSNVKTVNFKIKKATGAPKLGLSAQGVSGGSYATYENPVIGIVSNLTIGSKLNIVIKNSKGSVIKNTTVVQGSGTGAQVFDLGELMGTVKIGKYSATVKATTLAGKSVKKTVKFEIKKSPKVQITGAALTTADGLGSVSFTTSQSSSVSVVLKNSSGAKLSTILDKSYSAGNVSASFAYGSLAVGSYNVVITAKNSGGTSTVTKSFKVKKKPVVVTKPKVSDLAIRFSTKNGEDAVTATTAYEGKGAKIVFEVMWNDAEEIVYTYSTTTTEASGTASFTWDGYKANGFRAMQGSYTMRVYAVNSAGQTEYLRQNFTIGVG